MSHFKIRTHLLLLASLALLGILGVAIAGLWGMHSTVRGLETVYLDRVVPLGDLKKIADLYAVDIVDATHKTSNGSMSTQDAIHHIEQAQVQIRTIWEAYQNTQLIAPEKHLIEEIKPLMAKANAPLQQMLELIRTKNQAGLEAFIEQQLYPVIEPLSGKFSDLINIQLKEAQYQFELSQQRYHQQLQICVLILIITLLIGGIYTLRFSRNLGQQLGAEPHELQIISSNIAKGDLATSSLEQRQDTSGVLHSVQCMRENLKEVIGNINNASQQIEAATLQLSNSCVIGLDNATLQSETASSIAATVEQLSVSITHIANNAQQASNTTQKASEIAAHGMTQMQASANEIDQIASLVTHTSNDIDDLVTLSQGISQIVGVIRNIAEQTNLLALNAAIEAARAGEQGRGFAVVAEEVRNLATRTANSTEEIVMLVEDIQNGTHKAKRGMDLSREGMSRGQQLMENAQHSMNHIKDVLDESLEAVSFISMSLQEQRAASEHVANSVEKVAQSVENNLSSQQATANTTHQLKNMSEKLEVILQRFSF
ncbi:methyl-accepting chemotaxis protein [Pseudomonas protegens]|uniref:methyl-accepting chemotaxis protein n=2 Tax=Pseudomonas protegens TaxID=380021 RepID=UPI000F461735|nr:methyl-accepting chemotaxis protein [Pseudomonas protegens]ROL98733.1 chemotaxis protein [Pseudomonas protegens]ROM06893.1 chemotaxis protein [Pseudomonas protegens]ROM14337.1 chemotaxis protein [Pseudomonas protegens]